MNGVSPADRNARDRLLIRASAGSGKTYQLSTRYLSALRRSTPDRILATTFTRKAAGEILERVLTRLADAVLDPERRAELATALPCPGMSADQARELLLRMVRSLHRARIGTLDSFFAQVARAFALELGLPPNWRVLDEGLVDDVRSRAIRDVVESGRTSDIRRLANLLSKGDAKRSVTGLILQAVATHYDYYRMTAPEAWSLDVPPGMLTNEKLESVIEELLHAPLSDDSRCHTARVKDVEQVRGEQWEAFVTGGVAAKIVDNDSSYHGKQIDPAAVALYRVLLRHAAAVVTMILRNQNEATRDLLERFEAAFEHIKQNAGVLTFADVTHRIASVMDAEDAAHLAYRLDAQIDHLLLDEFQDTAPEQWRVLKPIARGLSGDSGSTFFCVGDVKQAIYGWRGGVAEIFNAVTQQIPEVAEDALDESYRSAPTVIDAVNRVFANLAGYSGLGNDADTVREFTEQFPEHSTVRRDAPGHVLLQTSCAAEEHEEQKDATLRYAAARIRELVAQLPPELTVGVLTRTNASVGKLIYELQQCGVPASEEGGTPVTDSAGVQLVLSALRLADHPGDTVARYHVAHSPLGPALGVTPATDGAIAEQLARDLRRELLERGYGDVIYDWMLALHPRCDERELTRLRQLVRLADEFQAVDTLRPSDFVRYVERRRMEDPRSSQVRVMTVHRSKGLEFDAVILPELDGKLIHNMDVATLSNPNDRTAPPVLVSRPGNERLRTLLPDVLSRAVRETRDRMVAEALCLLYVAMTRAAHGLYMYVAPETHDSLTPSQLLRHSLGASASSSSGEVLFEDGDAQWFRSVAVERETPEPPPAPEPLRVELAPLEAGRRRGLESVAPSRHGDEARRLVRLGNRLAPGRPRALRTGTIIHAWFETITWLDDGVPDDEQLRRIARQSGAADEELAELLAGFRKTLAAPAIRQLLMRGSYDKGVTAEVRNECPIATLEDGLLVDGTIDRLVLLSVDGRVHSAEVIDYKTDPVEPGETGRLVQKYGDQLRTYADAVARMYAVPRERIATRLVSLSAERVLDVPADPKSKSNDEPPAAGSQLKLF